MGIAQLSHHHANAFDPDAVEIIASAFDEVWQALERDGIAIRAEREAARDIVARTIMDIALLGERDRLRLRDAALRHLARRASAPRLATV